ncbi:hypothetical protein O3P69_015271 [Scylla paramamosain]|uniref:Uncharacterized protein n=1 Tax=Scylla paramamosain TaxID=85552 RepID=A0AAW0T5I3_SCYPA
MGDQSCVYAGDKSDVRCCESFPDNGSYPVVQWATCADGLLPGRNIIAFRIKKHYASKSETRKRQKQMEPQTGAAHGG